MLKFRADRRGQVGLAADCEPGEVRAELAGHWPWGVTVGPTPV